MKSNQISVNTVNSFILIFVLILQPIKDLTVQAKAQYIKMLKTEQEFENTYNSCHTFRYHEFILS